MRNHDFSVISGLLESNFKKNLFSISEPQVAPVGRYVSSDCARIPPIPARSVFRLSGATCDPTVCVLQNGRPNPRQVVSAQKKTKAEKSIGEKSAEIKAE
jgi:hypothetical protein